MNVANRGKAPVDRLEHDLKCGDQRDVDHEGGQIDGDAQTKQALVRREISRQAVEGALVAQIAPP